MRTIPLIILLAGVAVPAEAQMAEVQLVDGVAVAKHGTSVDTVQIVQRIMMPRATCPMPVAQGKVRDSMTTRLPRLPTAVPTRPVPIPTQRATCRNSLFAIHVTPMDSVRPGEP